MMTPDLFQYAQEKAAQTAGGTNADKLIHFLFVREGFHTARQITAILGMSDREIRQAAEQADGLVVSGPGSPGYCHIRHCPPEKLAHIANTLRSQARIMLARSIRLRNRAHQIIA